MGDVLVKDSTFYVLLLALLFLSAVCALVVVPILVLFNWWGYLVLGILGVSTGFLVNNFVMGLDDFSHHHHGGVWFVMIFGSLLNFFVLYYLLPVDVSSHSFSAGSLFAFCFLLPNFLGHIVAKYEKINK
ncbi:hypothetical protein K9L97_03030 [Candidatus Woesearchaeota archaeon]|nr:hypothetical protein [Candidatus Woesearchaeota archaeon]